MLACMILPRPDATMSLPQLVDKVSDAAQEASEWAFLKDSGVEDEEGRQIGEGDENDPEGATGSGSETGEEMEGDPATGNAPSDAQMNSQPNESASKSDSEPMAEPMAEPKADSSDSSNAQATSNDSGPPGEGNGESPGTTGKESQSGQEGKMSESSEEGRAESGEDSESNQTETQTGETEPEESLPDASQPQPQESGSESEQASMDWIGSLVKWLLYAALAAGAGWFFMKRRREIMAALRQFWANLLALFGTKPPQPAAPPPPESGPELPPFAAFQNPFANGDASAQSPEELVRYSFEALQAWAKERELERPPDQTPIEFARRLGAYIPELAHEAVQLTRLYSRYAYAGRTPPDDCVNLLQTLWAKLG